MSDAGTVAQPEEAGAPVEVVPEVVEPVAPPSLAEQVGEPSIFDRPTEAAEPAEAAAEEATPEQPAAEAAEEKPAETETPAEPEKPAEEAPKPEEAPPAEPEVEAKPPEPEPVVYEPPVLPEGLALDPERVKAFDEVLSPVRVPPETRQQLVDMYIAERRAWEQEAERSQREAFVNTCRSWREQIMSDPELGGAAFQTNTRAVAEMLDVFVGQEHMKEWMDWADYTGAGFHTAPFRLLLNVARKFAAPPSPTAPNNPPPDRGGAGGRGRRRRELYDHPRSNLS